MEQKISELELNDIVQMLMEKLGYKTTPDAAKIVAEYIGDSIKDTIHDYLQVCEECGIVHTYDEDCPEHPQSGGAEWDTSDELYGRC